MKIRMRSTSAGPEGVFHDGEVYVVGDGVDMISESEAKMLVEGKYAEYAVAPTPKGFVPERETAVVQPPETSAKGKPASEEKAAPSGPWGAVK